MELYFFHPDEYNLHFNCSFYDYRDYPIEDRSHPIAALCTFVAKICILPFYVLCLSVVVQRNFFQHASYQFMTFLMVLWINILVGSIFVDASAFFGLPFCFAPTAHYLFCCLCLGFYCCESVVIVILAFNRCLEMTNRPLANQLFLGKTVYWLIFPVIYGCGVTFFVTPPLIIPGRLMYSYNPHEGFFPSEHNPYNVHWFNNLTISIATPLLYTVFAIVLYRKQRSLGTSQTFKSSFYQAAALSGTSFLVNTSHVIYLIVDFDYPYTILLNLILNVHEMTPCVLCLTINPATRKAAKQKLFRLLGKNTSSSVQVPTTGA